MTAASKIVHIGSPPTNGADDSIALGAPYRAAVKLHGVADFLFHRYDPDAVAGQKAAKKGSTAKTTDNVESFVYRMHEDARGELAMPGDYLRGSIAMAAKYFQDPRSPRKSAMDLVKAGVIPLTPLASFGAVDWDYMDRRRVQVNRNGVTRSRPAMRAGWSVEHILMVTTPEYIPPDFLREILVRAGQLVGVGDFRPTFGRYAIDKFEILGD